MGRTRKRPDPGPSPNGDFGSGWEPLSSVPDDAFAGASMVDSATAGVQAFGNGTFGAAPAPEVSVPPQTPLQAPPVEATGHENLIDGFDHVNGAAVDHVNGAAADHVNGAAGLDSSLDPSGLGSPVGSSGFDPSAFDSSRFDSSGVGMSGVGMPGVGGSGVGSSGFDSPDLESPDLEQPPGANDPGWASALRVSGRAGAWALPLGTAGLVVAALWSWPTPGLGTNRPGTWLLIAVGSFAFGLLGVVSLAALLMPTPGRRWAASSTTAVVLGGMLLAPILGVLGLARPAVTNAAASLGNSATALDTSMIDNTVGRWLLVGGLTLLGVGVCLLGIAVLASGLLARFDGYLLLGGVGLAVFASWASWQFLLVIAAIVLLAAGLGLAWTASRVTTDGRGPLADD